MKSPRFLLYGIEGVYNYGCEAIVRGTEVLLHEVWPTATIKYASWRPKEDARRLAGSAVEVIPRTALPGLQLGKRIARRVVEHLNLPWTPIMEDVGFFKDTDAVLLIGGDLYTASRDCRWYNRWLLRFGSLAKAEHLPYILWAASIGPFESRRVRRHFQRHIDSDVSLVTCREAETLSYLTALGVQTPRVLCADPAFALSSEPIRSTARVTGTTIGVNLSPLSMDYRDPSLSRYAALAQQAAAVKKISDNFNADLVLIPHVICPFSKNDDDLRYLEALYLELPEAIRRRTHLIKDDSGYQARRTQLQECTLIVSARMHCAINAISGAVPTVFLAYSRKAYGMCQYIYGTTNNVIDIGEFTTIGPPLTAIQSILDNQTEIRKLLQSRLYDIREDARKGATALKECLSSTR